MNLYHKIVQQKMKSLTADELITYGKEYEITLSKEEAEKIIELIRKETIDVFNAEERTKWIRELAKLTSPQIAKQANELLRQFIK
jgi:Mn-dependent DtxR family transcriptional regulator